MKTKCELPSVEAATNTMKDLLKFARVGYATVCANTHLFLDIE